MVKSFCGSASVSRSNRWNETFLVSRSHWEDNCDNPFSRRMSNDVGIHKTGRLLASRTTRVEA